MTEFDRVYRELIRRVMTEGYEERNERTGHSVRALPGMTRRISSRYTRSNSVMASSPGFCADSRAFARTLFQYSFHSLANL